MIIVFWLQTYLREDGEVDVVRSHYDQYQPHEMDEALKRAEALRKQRAAGSLITHVCIQSELPEAVGQAGVSDPAAGYGWYKRRPDPATPVGRP